MGATLDVFTLYRLTKKGGDCEHLLLLKVTRPGYSNVVQQEEDWANDVVAMRQRVLLDLYMQHFLPQDCLEPPVTQRHVFFLSGGSPA